MNTLENTTIRRFEEYAQTLITLMYKITEKRFTGHQATPTPEDRALEASALALHEAVKTFLAVYRIE